MARRFIIDRNLEDNEQIEIRGEEAKHIFELRHDVGDIIEINDKKCKIIESDLLTTADGTIRHNSLKLSSIIFSYLMDN